MSNRTIHIKVDKIEGPPAEDSSTIKSHLHDNIRDLGEEDMMVVCTHMLHALNSVRNESYYDTISMLREFIKDANLEY